jgi:hypothetical protein
VLNSHLPQRRVDGLRWKDTLTRRQPKIEPLGRRTNTSDPSGRPLPTFAELSTVVDFNINTKKQGKEGLTNRLLSVSDMVRA